MGMRDAAKNRFETMKGRAKEAAGRATDDPGLEDQGKADRAGGDVRQAAENLKDAVNKTS
jgi:uncharacterized protein YjbJ (UPF0337 family)